MIVDELYSNHLAACSVDEGSRENPRNLRQRFRDLKESKNTLSIRTTLSIASEYNVVSAENEIESFTHSKSARYLLSEHHSVSIQEQDIAAVGSVEIKQENTDIVERRESITKKRKIENSRSISITAPPDGDWKQCQSP